MMIQQTDESMSQSVGLESARYLTDPLLIAEYTELQETNLQSRSLFQQLWKRPRFRLFMLRLSRLLLFAIFVATAIATISQLGLWNRLYFWLQRLF